jgi:hypothetical protein
MLLAAYLEVSLKHTFFLTRSVERKEVMLQPSLLTEKGAEEINYDTLLSQMDHCPACCRRCLCL